MTTNLTLGVHDDVPAGVYHADPAGVPSLNASIAKLLISSSPAHAYTAHPKLNPAFEPKVDKKFDVGTAAHELFLLGNDDLVQVVDAPSWQTAAAKDAREEARSEGMVALLTHEWERVAAMLAALREQLPRLDVDPAMFADGKPEQTLIWEDHGVLCRARLDWLRDDFAAVDDLKTCRGSAHPLAWANRTLWGMQAEIQAMFNARGVKAITGHEPEFRFLACETHPPFAICAVRLGEAARAIANHQIDVALEKWKRCLATGTWPAYPPVIVDAEPPPWAEQDMWALEELEKAA